MLHIVKQYRTEAKESSDVSMLVELAAQMFPPLSIIAAHLRRYFVINWQDSTTTSHHLILEYVALFRNLIQVDFRFVG